MNKSWTGNTRASWHDYRSPCIYHITLLKSAACPGFGRLMGSCSVPPGIAGSPYVEASETGKAVKAALRSLPLIHPEVRIYQYALMPDHLHILLRVEEYLDEPLGSVLAKFKVRVNKEVGMSGVFERGYNDRIINPSRSLDVIFRYIRDNPYRLAVRLGRPGFFQRVEHLRIGEMRCSAYGNLQLLQNPFKEAVIVHRADDVRKRAFNREKWIYTAANGGVLVSPFISKDEKAIRMEAESYGGKAILISGTRFGEHDKPSGRDFELCAEGRLLVIATGTGERLGREDCLKMNRMAEIMASVR